MKDGARILHVIPSLDAADGGPSHALRTMVSALGDSGIRVDVVTTLAGNAAEGGTIPLDPGSYGRCLRFRRVLSFYKLAPGIVPWLRDNVASYDLLHVHGLFSHSCVAAMRWARTEGVPYVVRPLGALMRFGLARRRIWIKRLSLRFVEGPLLRDASAVHVTSEEERRQAEELGLGLNFSIVPIAVSPGRQGSRSGFDDRHPSLAGRRIVLFLGRIDPVKNIESLIDAFARCAASHRDIALVLCGRGAPEYEAQLRSRAARTGFGDRVAWIGQVGERDKADAFAAAEIFVLPSHSENFGLSAAEAMAQGLPCILARGVAIAGEAAAAGAVLAAEGTPDALAEALDGLLRAPERRAALSAAARRFAQEQFGPPRMAARLSALYGACMARGAGSRR